MIIILFIQEKCVYVHRFTHEYRLNEHLIILKAFIVFMYAQEN